MLAFALPAHDTELIVTGAAGWRWPRGSFAPCLLQGHCATPWHPWAGYTALIGVPKGQRGALGSWWEVQVGEVLGTEWPPLGSVLFRGQAAADGCAEGALHSALSQKDLTWLFFLPEADCNIHVRSHTCGHGWKYVQRVWGCVYIYIYIYAYILQRIYILLWGMRKN